MPSPQAASSGSASLISILFSIIELQARTEQRNR